MAREDLRFHRGFFDNLKVRRLHADFDGNNLACPRCSLQQLWVYVAMHCPSGVFPAHFTRDDLEIVSNWRGQPGAFKEALLRHRFVLVDGGTLRIHDWEEWQPWVSQSEKRSQQGKDAAAVRYRKRSAKPESSSAETEISSADSTKQHYPNSTPNSNSNSNSNSIPEDEDVPDLPGAVIPWFNETVCPPFTPVMNATKTIRYAVLRASDTLREIHGEVSIGHEFATMKVYLSEAARQYEQGQVPCKWGLINLCKDENINKVSDGLFETKDGGAEWAAQAKAKGADPR